LSGSSSPTYSCVDRGADGPGNISDDPRFAGPDASDYHLKPDSPCINAGDPDFTVGGGDTDIDGDARILARRVDIGADEYLGPPLTKATFDSAGSEIVQEILRGVK